MGEFGKGTRHANGECLAYFLSTTALNATNTKFQHPMPHRTTWGGLIKKDRILTQYFNQIDYIMVDKKFRNSLEDARAYNGQDFNSDHSLLVTTIRMNELFTTLIWDNRQRGTLIGQEEAWPRNVKRYTGIGRKLALRAFDLSQKISDNYKENLAAQLSVDSKTEEAATSTTEELQRVAQAMEATAKRVLPVKMKRFTLPLKRTTPTRQLALKRVRLVLGDLSVVIAPGEAAPTRTPLAEIPAPRRAQPRRRTAAKRKADELEQIENRPSGLVNRTVRDAARAEAFAWDVNGREF